MSSDDPQIDLHPEALEKDIIYIPGFGPTPGIMNMVVRRALELLESVDEVEVFLLLFDMTNQILCHIPSRMFGVLLVRGYFPPHVMSLMGSLMQSGLLSSRIGALYERDLGKFKIPQW